MNWAIGRNALWIRGMQWRRSKSRPGRFGKRNFRNLKSGKLLNLQRSAPQRLDMLKPPAEDTELTRPANEKVRPLLAWRNARQALHTRVASFLGFAALL